MSAQVRRLVSVCTGSFILAEAGLLDGRRATTHWAAVEDFKLRFPKVHLSPEQIYTKDGHIYTSAGVTAGIDLAIALVEEDLGSELALRVAQALVTFMRRPGDQSQFNAPDSDRNDRDAFAQYIRDHLAGDLRLEVLADHFALSVRTFNRLFRKRIGTPPGRFIDQCRVERARSLLEETSEPISEVARQCGYSSSNGLCMAFERRLGVTPSDYRKRFSSSLGSTRTS
jgi:transcriptional regulator GlxA family with amidase domain